MRRYILIVLDGCGAGAAPDAAEFGDDDPVSATLPHVAAAYPLTLPTLGALGLGATCPMRGVPDRPTLPAITGRLREAGRGKDSVAGHWEMMGAIVDPAFPVWPGGIPAAELERFSKITGTQFLGGWAASGTDMLAALGAEHLRTGFPIAYTSADSVLQIAAHEDRWTVDSLHALCAALRSSSTVCRVIARPFVGNAVSGFRRTGGRRDFVLPPPEGNLIDVLARQGVRVHFIGRPGEFHPEAPGQTREATRDNEEHGAALARAVRGEGPGGDARFVFANFEDFDMCHGHRNDPIGFGTALDTFDRFLGDSVLPCLGDFDRLGITADHGNDPTTPSTDHSREFAPLICHGAGIVESKALGDRATFADWAADIAGHLQVPWNGPGIAFS